MCVRSKKYLLGKFFFITFIASSNIFASKIVWVFDIFLDYMFFLIPKF